MKTEQKSWKCPKPTRPDCKKIVVTPLSQLVPPRCHGCEEDMEPLIPVRQVQ